MACESGGQATGNIRSLGAKEQDHEGVTHVLSVLESILDIAVLVLAVCRRMRTFGTTVLPIFHPRLFSFEMLVLLDDTARASCPFGIAAASTRARSARHEGGAAVTHGGTRYVGIRGVMSVRYGRDRVQLRHGRHQRRPQALRLRALRPGR